MARTNNKIAQKANEALRKSEEMLQCAIELAKLTPFEWNPATGELNWDERCKTMWGLSPDAFVDFNLFLAGIHPHDRPFVEKRIAQAFDPAGDGRYEAEFRVIGIEDKMERWVLAHGRAFLDEQGNALNFIGTAQDITERKKAEEALRKSESHLERDLADAKQLQHFSNKVIHLSELNQVYGFLLDTAMKLMQSDFASIQLYSAQTETLSLIDHRNFHPQSAAFWSTVSAGSDSVCGNALQHRSRITVKDIETEDFAKGELKIFRLSGIRAVQSTPIYSTNGVLIGMLNTQWRQPKDLFDDDFRFFDVLVRQAADFIESKQAEGALRESEKKYRNLFETMRQGYIENELIRDANGRVVDYRTKAVNPQFERLTGISAGKAIGRTARELVGKLDPVWIETYERVVRTDKPEQFEREEPAFGRWFEVQAYPLTDDRFAILYDDITERKRNEQNLAILAEVNQLLTELRNNGDCVPLLGEKIAKHFDVKWCTFNERGNEKEEIYDVSGWNAPDVLSLNGKYCIKDYTNDEQIEKNNRGEVTIINDTQTHPDTNAEKYAAINVHSLILIPLSQNGKWKFSVSIIDNKPRNWRNDEIELIKELAYRIWTRVEKAKIEEALRESQNLLAHTFDALPMGIGIVDKDGVMRRLNPQMEYFLPNAIIPSREPTRVARWQGWDSEGKPVKPQNFPIARALRGEKVVPGLEMLFEDDNGHKLWTQVSSVPLQDENGEVTGAISIVSNIDTLKLSEEALRESEEKYRALFETIDEGFAILELVYDENGTLVDFIYKETNSAFSKHVGMDLKGKRRSELFLDKKDFLLEKYEHLARTGEPLHLEHNVKNLDDQWFQITASRIGGQDSKLLGVVFQNITERKQQEQRQNYLLKLNDILDSLTDISQIKFAASELLGSTLGVTRAYYAEVLDDDEHIVVQRGYAASQEIPLCGTFHIESFGPYILDQFRKGKTVIWNNIPEKTELTHEEKRNYAAISNQAMVICPLIRNNRFTATLCINNNMPRNWSENEIFIIKETAERLWSAIQKAKAEEALRTNEDKYRAVFETMIEACCIFDMIYDEFGKPVDWMILEANASYERQSGLKDVSGKLASEVMPGTEPYWIETFHRVAETGKSEQIEKWHQPTDRWVHSSTARVGGPESRRLVSVFYDITARKKAEETLKQFNIQLEQQVNERTQQLNEKNRQLEHTVSQLESFNYIASHDLQEPLRKIQIFVGLLNEYEISNPKIQKYITRINASSSRMRDLINSLLQYSRLGRTTDAFKPVNLNTILLSVKNDYKIIIREKGASIISNDLPTISAIPFQMLQLFTNLISNSLKFCEQQPEIHISARIVNGNEINVENGFNSKTNYVELIFRDNGIGFDNKYNKKIFEVFQRLESKSSYDGTGIGLSIVDKIIKDHYGFIKADGEKTKGSVFTIYLPVE